MADLARDVLGLLDHVGWASCRMVGISFGGMLAQEVAVTAPERIERLALLCTSAGGAGGSSYPLHELESLPEAERNAISLKIVDTRYTPEWLADHPLDQAIVRMRAESARAPKSEAQLRGAHEQLMARKQHDVSNRLGRITCPTFVAYGEYDGIAPKANSVFIAEHIANAELRGYEGGHLFVIQDPAAMPDVVEFLSQD
jgi:pimeloyl-ACP methyl ester carboxylesterase